MQGCSALWRRVSLEHPIGLQDGEVAHAATRQTALQAQRTVELLSYAKLSLSTAVHSAIDPHRTGVQTGVVAPHHIQSCRWCCLAVCNVQCYGLPHLGLLCCAVIVMCCAALIICCVVTLSCCAGQVTLSSSVAHENMVQLLDVFAEGTELIIVVRFTASGTLLVMILHRACSTVVCCIWTCC